MWGLVARCGNIDMQTPEDVTSILCLVFVLVGAWKKTPKKQKLPLHFREGNKLLEPFRWTVGLSVKMQAKTAGAVLSLTHTAVNHLLILGDFTGRAFFTPPLGAFLIRKTSSFITTILHCALMSIWVWENSKQLQGEPTTAEEIDFYWSWFLK